MDRNKSACCRFGFRFSDLDIPAREIYVLPFETNELGRSQARESPDREIKFRFFVTGAEKISELRWREDPNLAATVLRFRDVISFGCDNFRQIAAGLGEVEKGNDREANVVSRTRSALCSSQPIFDLCGCNRRDVHPEMFCEAVEMAAKRLQITHAHSVLFLCRQDLFNGFGNRFADRRGCVASAVFFCGSD